MAKGKSRTIDPISRMPNLGQGSYACTDFLGAVPDLLRPEPLRVMDGEKPNPSSHPNKSNPGVVRYFGSNA